MAITKEQEHEYRIVKNCYICKQSLLEQTKKQNHCHVTNLYSANARNECSLKLKYIDA